MVVTSTVEPTPHGTRVNVSQDVQIAGALAEYGRGMIQDVTNVLLNDFAANMQEDIGRVSRGGEPGQRTAVPLSGLGVGLKAMTTAIKRFFHRLFGGGGI